MRYDRAFKNIDRHPNYIVAAFMTSGTSADRLITGLRCAADVRASNRLGAVDRASGVGDGPSPHRDVRSCR